MTPKEKAKELHDKQLFELLDCGGKRFFTSNEGAKRAALICVDELIQHTPKNGNGWTFDYGSDFWIEVKKEIELTK